MALGHTFLAELLGPRAALTVAEVADGLRLADRPVVQALDALVTVLDALKGQRLRPEDFFGSASAVLLGESPRRYLSRNPLVKPEARLALAQALKKFLSTSVMDAGSVAITVTQDDSEDTASDPTQATSKESDTPFIAPSVDNAPAAEHAPATELEHRVREREAEVADRNAWAGVEERSRAGAEAQEQSAEAARRIAELESALVQRVSAARAEERNRARAEAAQQVDAMRRDAERLVREAHEAADERVHEAEAAATRAASESAQRELQRVQEECELRMRSAAEASDGRTRALEERLRQAEAALVERTEAVHAVEHMAAQRVAAVERWAEQRVAEVQRAANARIAELERHLPHLRPAVPAPPAEPRGADPRHWWQRR
ncbi:hypothetical protein PV342_36840 [Streptomyces sp. PA03-3a]|nr:hypothetical protein [Streptomyces sp. PA03-3a]